MVSIPRSTDKNRCNRLFRFSLLSSVTTRHVTSFRFNLRKYYNTFQSVLQTSRSFSYRSAKTLQPGSEPESRPGGTECFGSGRQTLHNTLRTFSDYTFSKEKLFLGTPVPLRLAKWPDSHDWNARANDAVSFEFMSRMNVGNWVRWASGNKLKHYFPGDSRRCRPQKQFVPILALFDNRTLYFRESKCLFRGPEILMGPNNYKQSC